MVQFKYVRSLMALSRKVDLDLLRPKLDERKVPFLQQYSTFLFFILLTTY